MRDVFPHIEAYFESDFEEEGGDPEYIGDLPELLAAHHRDPTNKAYRESFVMMANLGHRYFEQILLSLQLIRQSNIHRNPSRSINKISRHLRDSSMKILL